MCNVSLFDNQRLQASLSVKYGGLGLRRITLLAPPAFTASAVGTRDLQNQIWQCFAQMPEKSGRILYQQTGSDINAKPIPDGPSAINQQSWHNPVVKREFVILLQL